MQVINELGSHLGFVDSFKDAKTLHILDFKSRNKPELIAKYAGLDISVYQSSNIMKPIFFKE